MKLLQVGTCCLHDANAGSTHSWRNRPGPRRGIGHATCRNEGALTALCHLSFYMGSPRGQRLLQAAWRKPQSWRLLFHCFSNTGWYTFGAVMEGLLKHAATLLQHVVGSIVDSAPHPEVCIQGITASKLGTVCSVLLQRALPCAQNLNGHCCSYLGCVIGVHRLSTNVRLCWLFLQESLLTTSWVNVKVVVHVQPCAKVWASGFASALLPRRAPTSKIRQNVYAWMEAFFEQWLKGSPGVRLQQLAAVLHKYQTFPQLYIYSESDHVVPHTSVEAFMEVLH